MRYLLLAVLMLVLVSPASASLQIVSPSANYINSSLNNYAGALGGLVPSLVQVVTGNVEVLAAGKLTFYKHAAESAFDNTFHISDLGSNPYTIPETGDFGWESTYMFEFDVPANTLLSTLGARFTTNGSNGKNANINDINDGFGIFVDINGNYDPNRLYFGYDDNGAGPDDNHDDLIVSVLFTRRDPLDGSVGTVPEPISGIVWGLLASAAMMVPGVARRR